MPVVCASGDKFIADSEQKIKVHEMFDADICEMEAAGIVLTSNRNQVPCMFLRISGDNGYGSRSVSGGSGENCCRNGTIGRWKKE